MNESGMSRRSDVEEEAPKKRRRVEIVNENLLETPPFTRALPRIPLLPRRPPPPVNAAALASKIEEKLADVEIETRREIQNIFKEFDAKLRAIVAAQKQRLNNPKDQK